MLLILWLFSRHAAIAVAMAMVMSAMSAQFAPDSGKSPLELATKQNNALFWVYMTLLALVLVFTYLVWSSGNNVQEAIRQDAEARIKEATKDLPLLQKAASDAKIEQQNVEIELARQKEKAAKAEESLLRLKNELKDRQLSPEQSTELVRLLKDVPNGPIEIIISPDVSDAYAFANQIHDILHAAGWTKVPVRLALATNVVGLSIGVHDKMAMPPYVEPLQHALSLVGIHVDIIGFPNFPPELVEMHIGHKPSISPN